MTRSTDDQGIRNGVDTQTLFATREALRAQPELARFQFRARSKWVSGAHVQSRVADFYGAGQEHTHRHGELLLDTDYPAVLVGADNGPTPVELLLYGLAACLTAGLVTVAAARGITLTEVASTVAGDIDLSGLLGLDPQARSGYQGIHAWFQIKGDASADELKALLERSRSRSAVYDVLTRGVPITIHTSPSSRYGRHL